MIEYIADTDKIFESLADKTRRDILVKVSKGELTISEIVLSYDVSFAAVAKHIEVLEVAGLVSKRKDGRKRYVGIVPHSLDKVSDYLDQFAKDY